MQAFNFCMVRRHVGSINSSRNHGFAMLKPRPRVPVTRADLLYWKPFFDGDTKWWYYEGPLGKWFCLVGDASATEWIDEDSNVAEKVPDLR